MGKRSIIISSILMLISTAAYFNYNKEILIRGSIEDVDTYSGQAAEIKNKTGKLTIKIESSGGTSIGARLISRAISESEADITCKVEYLAFSAAAKVLASCKKVHISDEAIIMFHTPRLYEDGKTIFYNTEGANLFQYLLLSGETEEGWKTVSRVLDGIEGLREKFFNNEDIFVDGKTYKEVACKRNKQCEIVGE